MSIVKLSRVSVTIGVLSLLTCMVLNIRAEAKQLKESGTASTVAAKSPNTSFRAASGLQGANKTKRQKIELADFEVEHQMMALERSRHLLEMASVDEPAGHKAVAARHLESAINELKMDMRAHAKAKREGPNAVTKVRTP